MSDLPEVLAAVTLAPEDRLILVFPSPMDMREFDEIAEMVKESGLGGRVIVVHGAVAVAVRGEHSEKTVATYRAMAEIERSVAARDHMRALSCPHTGKLEITTHDDLDKGRKVYICNLCNQQVEEQI